MANDFQRGVESKHLDKLKRSELFRDKLFPDILNREVFPAIRWKKMHFYHRGGRLFEFDRHGYLTNAKYATGFEGEQEAQVRENKLAELPPIPSFVEGYERIKELCKQYAAHEDVRISELYQWLPFIRGGESNVDVVVLDIEASFDARHRDDPTKKQDRVDLVLYNLSTSQLMFVEAKRFSDSRISSGKGRKPEVVHQIQSYEAQAKQQRVAILEAYKNYVRIMNRLFGLNMPVPTGLMSVVPLLIFGFDADQRDGKLKQKVLPKLQDNGVFCVYRKNFTGMDGSATLRDWFKKAAKYSNASAS